MRVVVRQEAHRGWEHDPVAERKPAREEEGRDPDEQGDDALGVLLDRRGEEAPQLPEDDGERASAKPAQRLT